MKGIENCSENYTIGLRSNYLFEIGSEMLSIRNNLSNPVYRNINNKNITSIWFIRYVLEKYFFHIPKTVLVQKKRLFSAISNVPVLYTRSGGGFQRYTIFDILYKFSYLISIKYKSWQSHNIRVHNKIFNDSMKS